MIVSEGKTHPSQSIGPVSSTRRVTQLYLAVLCMMAAVRIFLGAASLPIFNDVDESQHFDLICKYSKGQLPRRGLQRWEMETAQYSFYYCTFEYLHRPESFKQFDYVYPPPIWKLSATLQNDLKQKHLPSLESSVNHEAQSPPLYYVIAAAWSSFGRLLGLQGVHVAYWVRLLNVPIQITLIIASYEFCRRYFPATIAYAVPAMVAFFPSTIFFSINNDVLCPLVVLIAIWMLLGWYESPGRGSWTVMTGLMISACLLVKLTNIAVYLVLAVLIVTKLLQAGRRGELQKQLPSVVSLSLTAVLPVACWMLYNRLVIGDWTGTVEKVELLGWTPKPWTDVLSHPLFTLAGQNAYWTRFCTSFYAGDMSWHGEPWMTFFPLNLFAWFSFILFPIGLVAYLRNPDQMPPPRSKLLGFAVTLLVAGSIGFLCFLSLRYDFGKCIYPSRDYPYFNSGRLTYGMLVPFLAYYCYGVQTLARSNKTLTAVLLATSVMILIPAQVTLFQQTAVSQSNWFHTPM